MLWVAAIATVVSFGVGIFTGWRSRWRAMAVAGLVMAALAGVPVATLWGCIASGQWGPWFSLFPVYAIGLLAAMAVTLGVLATAFATRGRRHEEVAPQRPARAAIVVQMLVLLVQLGLVLWMSGEHVPNV
jgi:hypothetical protein